MTAKFRLENIFAVAGSIVICGPIIEGEITMDSVIRIGDKTVEVYRMELFRKFVKRAIKGDNVGIFLKKGTFDRDFLRGFTYHKTNQDLDVTDIQEIRNSKLEDLGI